MLGTSLKKIILFLASLTWMSQSLADFVAFITVDFVSGESYVILIGDVWSLLAVFDVGRAPTN